jgi:peroxin-5
MVSPLQPTARAFQWETNSKLIPANQHQAPTMKQQALDDVDWEAIFQSLEPAMKEPDTRIFEGIHSPDHQEVTLAAQISHVGDEVGVPDGQLFHTRPMTNYIFQDENPFSEIPSPFEEGMQIIRNDGNLSFAALAFEAACQLDHTHLEAWRMLGSVQSENEREGAAIKALEEALNLDPGNLDVLVKLAVSYTNEGFDDRAYECLEKWLRTKYPYVPITEAGPGIEFSRERHTFERIKESFIQAAQYSSTPESIDPDVQVGLGVLLFSDENYEMSADCFASAIHSITPGGTNAESQLHLLWNRYGACLGNMGRHEEAIEAYEMALAIKPNFTRARCNLGLLYYNKNDAAVGARNILQALQAHREAESQFEQDMLKIVKVGTSHGRLEELNYGTAPFSIYESLKRCCNSLCRWDLAEAVGPNMDLREFQKELDNL